MIVDPTGISYRINQMIVDPTGISLLKYFNLFINRVPKLHMAKNGRLYIIIIYYYIIYVL